MKRSYMKYFAALLLFGFNGIVASFIDLSSYEIVLLRTFIGNANHAHTAPLARSFSTTVTEK